MFEDDDRQVRLSFEAAAFGAEYHLPPDQHGPLTTADGTGPGDRAVLAVAALRKCLTSPPASTGADLATRALKGGTLLAELTSRSPVVSLAVLALLHSGRLVEAHEAADAVVTDARDRGAPIPYRRRSCGRWSCSLVDTSPTPPWMLRRRSTEWDGMHTREPRRRRWPIA